jgi:hypothetical protein
MITLAVMVAVLLAHLLDLYTKAKLKSDQPKLGPPHKNQADHFLTWDYGGLWPSCIY